MNICTRKSQFSACASAFVTECQWYYIIGLWRNRLPFICETAGEYHQYILKSKWEIWLLTVSCLLSFGTRTIIICEFAHQTEPCLFASVIQFIWPHPRSLFIGSLWFLHVSVTRVPHVTTDSVSLSLLRGVSSYRSQISTNSTWNVEKACYTYLLHISVGKCSKIFRFFWA